MAIKTSQRIFCVDDHLVILEKDEIIETLEIDKEVFYAEVVKQIKEWHAEGKYIRSIVLFKSVVEKIFGIPLKHFGYKLNQKGIHESSFYNEYLEFLFKEMKLGKKEPLSEETLKRKERDKILKFYDKEMYAREVHRKYIRNMKRKR